MVMEMKKKIGRRSAAKYKERLRGIQRRFEDSQKILDDLRKRGVISSSSSSSGSSSSSSSQNEVLD